MNLATYRDLLTSGEPPDSYVEVRRKLPSGGMEQDFIRVGDRRLIPLLKAFGRRTDTYVGVAPRIRQEGGRDAIERAHAVFADCDSAEAIEALKDFEPAASMIVNSGSGRHAYWSVFPPLAPDELERANRRLAYRLGADMRATDAARILRPPETHNFKTGEAVPVEVEHLAVEVYAPESIVGALADPPAPERPTARTVGLSTATDDPLLTIAPAVYVELLTGREVGRDGKIACPFHDDRTPSLHAFGDPERGWTCFGCPPDQDGRARGGTIIDFGAYLWGLEPRGAGYWEIRRRLEAELIPALRETAA